MRIEKDSKNNDTYDNYDGNKVMIIIDMKDMTTIGIITSIKK